MANHENKFLVVTFVDNSNPPERFVEPVPWKWVKENFVYYPNNWKLQRQKSNADSTPDYQDVVAWEKCQLTSIKGVFSFREFGHVLLHGSFSIHSRYIR